jgi:nucleoside-diphosphate-sugar epimerase
LENRYWDYSRKKADCEAVLRSQSGLRYTIVRPSHTVRFNVPTALSEREVAIYRMRKGMPVIVPGDGTSLWTLTHARDFAPPFVKLFGQDRTIGEAYNLTSPHAYRWDQIYRALGRAVDVDEINILHVPSDVLVKYRPDWKGGLFGDKMWTSVFDNSKIKSVVGDWLDELMRLTVAEWLNLNDIDSGGLNMELNKLFDDIVSEFSRFPHENNRD